MLRVLLLVFFSLEFFTPVFITLRFLFVFLFAPVSNSLRGHLHGLSAVLRSRCVFFIPSLPPLGEGRPCVLPSCGFNHQFLSSVFPLHQSIAVLTLPWENH
jgi:hypothetical protein